MARRPRAKKKEQPFGVRRERTLREIDRAVDAFKDVEYSDFEVDLRLQREAHGWLAVITQDLLERKNHASLELTVYYRDLRNNLGHAYIEVTPQSLWNALQRLPDLRKSVDLHRDDPQAQAPEPPNKGLVR